MKAGFLTNFKQAPCNNPNIDMEKTAEYMMLLDEKKCISYEIALLKTELIKRKADLAIVRDKIKNGTSKKFAAADV